MFSHAMYLAMQAMVKSLRSNGVAERIIVESIDMACEEFANDAIRRYAAKTRSDMAEFRDEVLDPESLPTMNAETEAELSR